MTFLHSRIVKMSEREWDGVEAALRLWQRTLEAHETLPDTLMEIAEDHGTGLTVEEIDVFLERVTE